MNTLIISDLHIAGRTTLPNTEVGPTNKNLIDFIDYYTLNRIKDEPWLLIINGDAVDYLSAMVYPKPEEEATLEERLHGFGSTLEKTLIKSKIIIDHFPDFFGAIARFIVAGNKLKIISGNHDPELSFPAVQKLLIDELHKFSTIDYDAFANSISFHSWFYYEPGVLYVEHGHQYDEYCSVDYALAPMDDDNSIVPSVAHLGTRYFVSKIPHYDPSNAEEWGFFEYMKWVWTLGIKKAVYSLTHYVFLVYNTLLLWNKLRTTEEERKFDNDLEIGRLAGSMKIGAKKLRRLYHLRSMPVTRGLFKLASTYFIDRMILIMFAVTGMIFFAVHSQHHWKIVIPSIVLIAVYLLNKVFNKIRFDAPSSIKLRKAAQRINKLMPAKLITFGHTHAPEVIALDDAATYINSGGWTEDGKYTYILITDDTYELKYWTQ